MPSGPTKRQAALVRSLKRASERRATGLTLCEGVRACAELLACAPGLVELAVAAEGARTPLDSLPGLLRTPPGEFERLATTENPQGALLVVRTPQRLGEGDPRATQPFTLGLDRLADPGNVGTILRTAMAVGLGEVLLADGTADPFSPKAVRAAVAAQFRLAFRRFPDSAAMAAWHIRTGGGAVYAAVPSGGADCFEEPGLFDGTLLLLGSEAAGVSPVPGARTVSIPMPGPAESLNVAQAATVLLFESVRRWRHGAGGGARRG